MAISKAEYDAFQLNHVAEYHRLVAQANITVAPVVTTPLTGTVTTAPNAGNRPIDLFRRGIKRDPGLFPELKNEEENDTWHQAFETQAHAQDVANVLVATYAPTSLDDIELFNAHKTYVYAVLHSKVQTDRGRAIIREHVNDRDGQVAYDKLRKLHTSSTKAKMTSSDILTYITSARLGTNAWKGTTEAFITHWQKQVQKYERL